MQPEKLTNILTIQVQGAEETGVPTKKESESREVKQGRVRMNVSCSFLINCTDSFVEDSSTYIRKFLRQDFQVRI